MENRRGTAPEYPVIDLDKCLELPAGTALLVMELPEGEFHSAQELDRSFWYARAEIFGEDGLETFMNVSRAVHGWLQQGVAFDHTRHKMVQAWIHKPAHPTTAQILRVLDINEQEHAAYVQGFVESTNQAIAANRGKHWLHVADKPPVIKQVPTEFGEATTAPSHLIELAGVVIGWTTVTDYEEYAHREFEDARTNYQVRPIVRDLGGTTGILPPGYEVGNTYLKFPQR